MKTSKQQEIENFINNLEQSYLSDHQLMTLAVNPECTCGGGIANRDCSNGSCSGSTNRKYCLNKDCEDTLNRRICDNPTSTTTK